MIKLYTKNYDGVIGGNFLTGTTNYSYAIENLYPLINRLDIQRRTQSESFYKRLEDDLKENCIMPPLTIAFVEENDIKSYTIKEFQDYVNKNIASGFILDGIQRLNTLNRVYENKLLPLRNPLHLNIIICKSKDNLLYRMVTINNGQKPMTARHQIEILASYLYNFDDFEIPIVTEKEADVSKLRKGFKKADIITSYIAFLSNTTNLENSKIIESKMDELIAKKIIDSNITNGKIEFAEILKEISRLIRSEYILSWLKNTNNLVGFVVGIKTSLKHLKKISLKSMENNLRSFEGAFKEFDVSKIKLSRERRKLSEYYFENLSTLGGLDADELLLEFSEIE